MMGLSDYLKNWHTSYSWLHATFNGLACSFQKVVRVQSKQDNQVYKEMKVHMLWSQLPSDRKNIGLEKQQKTLYL